MKGNAPDPWVRKSHPSWCFDQFMSITGTVWLDGDRDGWQDADELGRPTPSVLIELFQTNSGTMTLVDSVTTSGG